MTNIPPPVHQTTTQVSTRSNIISYQKLRAFIGLTGILLPVIAVFGCLLFGNGYYSFQNSISHYYYSVMHIVFVCIICVLGGFLITYQGNTLSESRLSNLAGCFAFGIAAFPTTSTEFRHSISTTDFQYLSLFKPVTKYWGYVHYGFAGGLFICFIIFCLYFFQKPDAVYKGEELIKFKKRKRFYKFSGWVIIVSIIMIALFSSDKIPQKGIFTFSTFIFETTSLWAFGSAWLVKGSASLKNVPVIKKVIQPLR